MSVQCSKLHSFKGAKYHLKDLLHYWNLKMQRKSQTVII